MVPKKQLVSGFRSNIHPLGLPRMLAENRVEHNPGFTELFFWYIQNKNYDSEKNKCTCFFLEYSAIKSANARILAENWVEDNWGFTEHLFCYWVFLQKIYGFEKVPVVPGFPSSIHHLTIRQLGLPTRECWRITRFWEFLKIPNFRKKCKPYKNN